VAQLHEALGYKPPRSIPKGVVRIYLRHNIFGGRIAQGITQPLTEVSTRNISWSKGGWCVWPSNLQLSYADCEEIWEPHPPGTFTAHPGSYEDCFSFTLLKGW
jgi:hypothetical protein